MRVTSGIWVTLEGLNGVGKTYLARQAAARLGPSCHALVELPDALSDQLPGKIIGVLATKGDPFLRTGLPRTETLLLAALQVHRHEAAAVLPGQSVLEDRGPHTVAAYQSAVLCPLDATEKDLLAQAETVLAVIQGWRPLPDRVLLIHDDPVTCRDRLETRWERHLTNDETTLMTRVSCIYQLLADADPARFQLVDRRGLSEADAVDVIVAACVPAGKET